MDRSLAPAMPPIALNATDRPADFIQLIDTRAIRALRAASDDMAALDLTRERKIAMWVGVGVFSAYLITRWIEDNVAFFP